MICLAKISGETKGIWLCTQIIRCGATGCRLYVYGRIAEGGKCIERARNEKIEGMIAEMTAAVLYGKEDLRLERVAVPQAGPGGGVGRVGPALAWGTDWKGY